MRPKIGVLGTVLFYAGIGFFVLNIPGLAGSVIVDSFGTSWFGSTWLPQGFTTRWWSLMALVIIALIFVKPTQFVVRLKNT